LNLECDILVSKFAAFAFNLHYYSAAGGIRTKTRRVAAPVRPGEALPPAARAALSHGGGGRPPAARRRGGVLIDLASPLRLHRAQVLELLQEHLRRNIVRSGGVYLLQTVGIPQGSVLSTLLCGVGLSTFNSDDP
jgi:telomerase reverse transcriptase